MLCIKTEVKESRIPVAGKGLFSLEFAPKGSIVFVPVLSYPINNIVLEAAYREKLSKTDIFPVNAGMRWGGHYFLHCDETPDNTDYINHANNPNLLSCLGFFFARYDISSGDELTIDYRHIAIEGSVEVITGGQEKIIGLSPKEALLQSAQQLINLIQEVDDIHCFNLPKAPD